MTWRHVLDLYDQLDRPDASGARVAEVLRGFGAEHVDVVTVTGAAGSTDFVRVHIAGDAGRTTGGDAPTLGVIGRLGGLGARPEQIGLVSDGEGALVALAVAAKLSRMSRIGDRLPGDVLVATHVCPNAPTRPHQPVPFMDSPVDMEQMNWHEIDARMEAILSVDTTRGNRICNQPGFAISPTVKEGWVLRCSEDLLDIATRVTGDAPTVLPLTTQDITPYGNGVFHLNSILQPATATAAPVVGVALTTSAPVAGSATGATNLIHAEAAARFCVEVAKDFGRGFCAFYDPAEFARLVDLYGPMTALQSVPNRAG